MVSLFATGGVLVYAGSINVGMSGWIRQGHRWAFAMSAVVTFPCWSTRRFLFPPITYWMFGVIINGLYLCFLIKAWASGRGTARRSPDALA